ncbi:MAG: indole-3-glycerol phosphate synthase TrpC [Actinobacteria bacterium]|nr:indole-3-glycerol phosphate synthase TrpC [Actinomycetota bacterium]
MGFLSRLVEDLRRDLLERPLNEGSLRARVHTAPEARPLDAALRGEGLAVIAEVKRSSPSAGHIAEVDAGEQVSAYQSAGASAISVLTEPRHFGGSMADLRLARRVASVPLLRKDFVVHPAQVVESRVEGADAVLLIAAVLDDLELRDLLETAEDVGLQALVEAHSEPDVDRAVAAGAAMVGVNARDLETLEVDFERALGLLERVPADRVRVMESGISSPEQARRAAERGADAILVGEALMRAEDPARLLAGLLGRDQGLAEAAP